MNTARVHRKNWPFRIAMILIYLELVALWMSSVLYAKYTSHAEVEDTSRVAVLYVEETGELVAPFAISIYPGSGAQKKEICIVNNSETTIACSLKATNKGDLPLILTWEESVDAGTGGKGTGSVSNAEVSGDEIAIGGQRTYQLQIQWNDEQKDFTYNREIDLITVTVVCEQVD